MKVWELMTVYFVLPATFQLSKDHPRKVGMVNLDANQLLRGTGEIVIRSHGSQ